MVITRAKLVEYSGQILTCINLFFVNLSVLIGL